MNFLFMRRPLFCGLLFLREDLGRRCFNRADSQKTCQKDTRFSIVLLILKFYNKCMFTYMRASCGIITGKKLNSKRIGNILCILLAMMTLCIFTGNSRENLWITKMIGESRSLSGCTAKSILGLSGRMFDGCYVVHLGKTHYERVRTADADKRNRLLALWDIPTIILPQTDAAEFREETVMRRGIGKELEEKRDGATVSDAALSESAGMPPAEIVVPNDPKIPPEFVIVPNDPEIPPGSAIVPEWPTAPPESSVVPERPNPVLPESDDVLEDAVPAPEESATDQDAAQEPSDEGGDGLEYLCRNFLCDVSGKIIGCRDVVVTDGVLCLPADADCTGIAAGAFDSLSGEVYELYIPANITMIEDGAFDKFAEFCYIQVHPDNPVYGSREGYLYMK